MSAMLNIGGSALQATWKRPPTSRPSSVPHVPSATHSSHIGVQSSIATTLRCQPSRRGSLCVVHAGGEGGGEQQQQEVVEQQATTTFVIAAAACTLLAGALLTVWREPLEDYFFYESLGSSGGLGLGDLTGGLLWGVSLWFCSPAQLLLLFLGKIEVERPSDWVLELLGRATGQSVGAVDYAAPAALKAAAAGLCLAGGMGMALGFNYALGDATWSVSSGIGACMAAGVYEVGRPRRISVTEAQTLEAQWQDFAVFASARLQTQGRCHESEVFTAFRRSYPKYRSPEAISDSVLRDMVRNWQPDAERTPNGFYKNLSLAPKVDGFTGVSTGTALPTTAPGTALSPQELLGGQTTGSDASTGSQ